MVDLTVTSRGEWGCMNRCLALATGYNNCMLQQKFDLTELVSSSIINTVAEVSFILQK